MSQSTPKDSSRVRGDARRRREQKQAEAIERNEAYAKLKPEDQLARIEGRCGASKRESEKLMHKIQERRKVAKGGNK